MKLIFMGTPAFAVGTLRSLYEAGHEITAVFTQPDKPVGRKQVLTPSPVKETAEALGIPVFQPRTLRDGQALALLKTLEFDLIVVVAYGKILPQEILDLPRLGCLNIHGSLLPRYRGASPIQWSIVCGETETGVTAMYMDAGMDTGDIIEMVTEPIWPDDTGETLAARLAVKGAALAVKTVEAIGNGTAPRVRQPENGVTYAPILTKETGRMDFSRPASALCDLVRGLSEWPTASFEIEDTRVKVYRAAARKGEGKPCGTVLCGKGNLIIQCGGNTAIELLEIGPQGKNRMAARDWLNGHPLQPGTVCRG